MSKPDTTTTATPLDHLDDLAAQVDADTTGTLPDGSLITDQPAPTDYQTEAAGTVDMIAAMIGGYCAPAGDLFTDDKKRAVVGALVPVMVKYQFSLGALPCELTLIIVAGPLMYQASKLVANQMRQEQAQAQAAKPAQVARPSGTETPEQKRTPQEALYP